jgi:integrase
MKQSTLKNIVRRDIRDASGEVRSWEVLDLSGQPVLACSLFVRKLDGYAFATRKRYVEAVCKFVDYLFETGVLGSFDDDVQLPTRKRINEAIDAYVPLLLRGSAATVEMLQSDKKSAAGNAWLINAAKSLRIEACQRKSLDNVIAALNLFLKLSESLAHEARDLAEHHGVKLPAEYTPLINAVEGFSKMTSFERSAIRSSSMLGGVIRMHGEIRRPAGIKSVSRKAQSDTQVMDFPVSFMPALVAAATSWRDRALWLLLLASGIRKSEALNLQWSDIDHDKRCIYVLDPECRRYGKYMTAQDKVRFKGRTVSWTYLWEPWRTMFFEALAEYRKREWRLPTDGNGYVFQILKIQDGQIGVPLVKASDAALNQSFKRAVIKAGVPTRDLDGQQDYPPHSLRHAYGVYMLNYIPIAPGVYGFSEADVQCLMGHDSILSTRKYARRKQDVLQAKLAYSDMVALNGGVAIPVYEERAMLPAPLVQSLEMASAGVMQ